MERLYKAIGVETLHVWKKFYLFIDDFSLMNVLTF
jgi:hypothetical protein